MAVFLFLIDALWSIIGVGYEWIFSQCDCVRRPIDANTPFSSHDKNTLCNAHKMLACLYTHCFIKQKSFPWTSWMKRGHQGSYYLTHVLNKDRLAYTSAKCLLFPKAPQWTLWKEQGWSPRVNQCCKVKKDPCNSNIKFSLRVVCRYAHT